VRAYIAFPLLTPNTFPSPTETCMRRPETLFHELPMLRHPYPAGGAGGAHPYSAGGAALPRASEVATIVSRRRATIAIFITK